MITYKGRVVYEREKHLMTEKDAARIMKSVTAAMAPDELAKKLWGITVEVVELRMLEDEDIVEFVTELLKLIVNWVGSAQDWLWEFLAGLLLPSPADPSPPPGEEPDA